LNVKISPPGSTAAQNEDEAHEIEMSGEFVGSILTGALQALPSNVTASVPPTATQNDADGHDTDTSLSSLSIVTASLHELPLKVTA
jgi:hypothetical protein